MHVHFVGEVDDGISVSSHHARALAGAGIAVTFDNPADKAAPLPDILHIVTGPQRSNALLRRLSAARTAGATLVRYWSGRDLLWAQFHGPSRDFAEALSQMDAVQLARSDGLAEELRSTFKIDSTVLPILTLHVSSFTEPEPMPARFTALCYLPSQHRGFFGGEIVDHLIRQLPRIRFLILGDPHTDYSAFKHVESLGFIDNVERAIRRSTVLIEPRMDGALSRLSLEMLSHGRHVISTHQAPHFSPARSPDEFCDALRALQYRSVPFNLEAREFACREHDPTRALESLLGALTSARTLPSWGSTLKSAVSGVSALLSRPASREESYALPDVNSLPPGATAFKALLADEIRAASMPGLQSAIAVEAS